MKESLQVGFEYLWPRVLLDPIKGIDEKNQGLVAWGYVDRVRIHIDNVNTFLDFYLVYHYVCESSYYRLCRYISLSILIINIGYAMS